MEEANDLSPNQICRVAELRLTDYAHTWWMAHKSEYPRGSEGQILTWQQMRSALLENFVLDDYALTLRDRLDNCKQKNSVQSYNIAFKRIIMQIPKLDVDTKFHQYFSGLRPPRTN